LKASPRLFDQIMNGFQGQSIRRACRWHSWQRKYPGQVIHGGPGPAALRSWRARAVAFARQHLGDAQGGNWNLTLITLKHGKAPHSPAARCIPECLKIAPKSGAARARPTTAKG
jgi:hypothetical protein